MKTIQHTTTLFYYDGPQVFEARDAIGGHYVAVLGPTAGSRASYLVAGVPPERLRLFRCGLVDLRTLLTDSDEQELYTATATASLDQPLALDPLRRPLTDSGLLPDSGFLLHDHPTDDYVLKEARERNNLIMAMAADPPEAASQHRIRANTLAELLHRVQSMVKNAYRAAMRVNPPLSRRQDDDILDVVVPASAGSFRIVLEAATMPDLFGRSGIALALRRMDELFENAASPETTLTVARANRGHLAGSYLKLLRFLVKNNTGLHYSWAEPASTRPHDHAVSQAEAEPLVDALSGVTNLGVEKISLDGEFDKFNRGSGDWGLRTEDGMRSGKVREGGPSLDGLEVGGHYRFYCDEEIEEIDITGREARTLYLNRHDRI